VIDFDPLYAQLATRGLDAWAERLPELVRAHLDPATHGDLPGWLAALAALPSLPPTPVNLTADCVRAGTTLKDETQSAQLTQLLQRFHPWRKGPFCIHGVHIDTEWRSDWKWKRLSGAVDLRGKMVLDVGCGNGYYGWRMLGAGAHLVVGVDPTLLYVMQYAAMRHFLGPAENYVLPLRLEDLPPAVPLFDAVFSMGVLYHRRDPLAHLGALRSHLRPGGTLCVETLVIEGEEGAVLEPAERYARMKNVWQIPSVPTAMRWLADCGMRDVRCIDVTPTTTEEQRTTDWMRFESLAAALDPADPQKTCEGYPAPRRATLIATR